MPPAALAHPGHLALASHRTPGHGLRRRRRGWERAPGLPEGLTVLRPGDDTGSQQQRETGPAGKREAGRKEEKAQAQPLRRAGRTTAAEAVAAAAAERAGRAPGGTCAQSARPAPPLTPALPVHWSDQIGGGSKVGGAGGEGAGGRGSRSGSQSH